MAEIVLTIAIVLIPFLLVLFMHTNAAILFFILTAAATLQNYLDKDVANFTSTLLPGKNIQTLALVLFVFPFFVGAIAFRNTVSNKKLALHLLLALFVGACLIFIGPQFLPASVVKTIQSSDPYKLLSPYSSLVIAATFLLSIVSLWFSHPKEFHPKHGH